MGDPVRDTYVSTVFGADPAGYTDAASGGLDDGWTLQSIVVTPRSVTAPAGQEQKFTATGFYSGTQQDETAAVEWSASDPSVTWDANRKGVALIAHASGSVTITATEPASGVSGNAVLTIGPAPQSTMSDADRAAQEKEAAGRKEPKKWDGVEKCVALGHADGAGGRNARPELVRKLYAEQLDLKGLVFAYMGGFETGQYERLEKLAGPLEVTGKASAASHARLAYEAGVREGRQGQATSREDYAKVPQGWDIDPKVVLRGYDLGFKDGQAAVPHDKDSSYKTGLEDGKFDDPIHRKDIEELKNPDLAKAYEAGFAHAKEMSDQAWDEAGGEVDQMQAKAPQDKPVMSTYDKIMTSAGVLSTLISVLEAKGLVARAGVGTTIGVILLPIMAFKIGTDFSVAQEEKQAAIGAFERQFSGLVIIDSLELARALLKAKKVELRELTPEGEAVIADMLQDWRGTMIDRIKTELDGSPNENTFVALHAQWVKTIAKQAADMLANPRLHQ